MVALEGTAGGRKEKRFGPGVLDALARRDWPGNVRELENMVERLRVLTHGSIITLADLSRAVAGTSTRAGASGGVHPFPAAPGGKSGELLMIEDALRRCGGDRSKAARYIGWNRQKLYRRLRSYAIPTRFGKAA